MKEFLFAFGGAVVGAIIMMVIVMLSFAKGFRR